MNAVILSVGDELVTGAVVDTNSAWLSRRLLEHGLSVIRHVTVGDRRELIAGAIAAAAGEAEVVIVTGGLGPTADDLTRQGLAQALGVSLRQDERCLLKISGFFAALGRPMTPSNRLQALVPEGAQALDNDCGTAPGIAARVGDALVLVMPGVPHEMMDMFDKQVVPRLPPGGCIATKVLHTVGMGESAVGEKLADLMDRARQPAVGTTASDGIISVRIAAAGSTTDEARALAELAAGQVRARLGEIVFGQDQQTLPQVVGELLAAKGQTLATAESCTGGMLGEMLTAVPGSSRYFLGGMVCYADSAKADLLGVPKDLLAAHGAVSQEVAAAMAQGAGRKFSADWGIGVTGIAGPTGGTPDKPVGLVYIAIAGPGRAPQAGRPCYPDAPQAGRPCYRTTVHRYVFPGRRDFIRRRTCLAALNHLRQAL